MADKFKETDEKILAIARRLFSQNGIVNIEMKDICAELGCSRSTLYRHFSSKESILFKITEESVRKIMDAAIIPPRMNFENGYEAITWQLKSQITFMLNNVDEIIFMRDFDHYYVRVETDSKEVIEYEKELIAMRGRAEMLKSLTDGIADGSIKPIKNVELGLYTLINSCIGIAQRILPRETIYRKEIGYGREMVEQLAEYLLLALKA